MTTVSRRTLLGTALAAGLPMGRPAQAQSTDPAHFGLKPGKPYAGTEVTIMLPNAAQYRAQRKRLGQLEDLTGIKAIHSYVPYGQLLDKITTEAVSGSTAYDLITYQDTWGSSLVPYMDPVEPLLARDNFDAGRFADVFVKASTYDGKIYGLPIRGQPQLLFYRKDLLAEVGAAPPKTWEEVVTVGNAIQAKFPNVSGIAMDYGKGNGFQNLFLWANFLWGRGTDMVDAERRPLFNSEAGVRATEEYLGLLHKHKVANPSSVQFIEGDKVNSMAQGNSAMVVVWWWAWPVLTGGRSKLTAEQVGFAPVPHYQDGPPISIGQCMPFSVSKNSRKKDAAWEVLKWMASPELEVDIATDQSDPDTKEIIVTQKTSLRDPRVNAVTGGLQNMAYESLLSARPMPLLREWPQMATVLENTISDLAASNKPVKPALDDAAAQVTRVMRRGR